VRLRLSGHAGQGEKGNDENNEHSGHDEKNDYAGYDEKKERTEQ
jgi:hypothetical protein